MDQNLLSSNLKSIFILRLISTISFGIFFCSLSLIMFQVFHLSVASSASLSALFFSFYYTLPLLGGKVGDYIKNYKQMFITGKCFQLISALALIYTIKHQEYLYLGLGLFLADSMVSTVSLNMLITNFFAQKNTAERGAAFVRSHVWANIGFIVSLGLSGAAYRFYSVESLFYMTAFFSLMALLYSYFFIKKDCSISTKSIVSLIAIMLLVCCVTTVAFINYYLTREIIIIAGFIAVLFIVTRSMIKAEKSDKQGIIRFMLFMLCSLLFWSVDMLGPTFLPVFISNNVNAEVFGLHLPPQWLQIMGPITIVGAGYILAKIFSNNASIVRAHVLIIGLGCTSIGLVLLNLGMDHHTLGLQLNCIWIISYLAIMAVAEILIAPVCTAAVGDYIAKEDQGIYTGIAQMVIGFSVIFSGVLAEHMLTAVNDHSYYLGFLLIISLIMSCGMIGMIAVDRKLQRVIKLNG